MPSPTPPAIRVTRTVAAHGPGPLTFGALADTLQAAADAGLPPTAIVEASAVDSGRGPMTWSVKLIDQER